MHEVLIVDVEIMSMLIPSFASVSNIVAAMPGCDRMPDPDERHPSHVGVRRHPGRAELVGVGLRRLDGHRQVVVGDGERDVGRPVGRLFCTIMSTMIDLSASGRKRLAATPGLVGDDR